MTAPEPLRGPSVGRSVPRKEDPRLLRGRGRFTADLDAAGQAHLRVVRSPVAHARLVHIDCAAAAGLPGVVAVATAADILADLGSVPAIPVRLPVGGRRFEQHLQPVLAGGVVRYVGEPVAVVVAADPYTAEDAAEAVAVDYEDLPAVLAASADPEGAAAADVVAVLEAGYGDVEAAFARAAHVVGLVVAVGRHSAVPLEPRALLADPGTPDAHGAKMGVARLDIWGATKVPAFNRGVLAGMLRIEPERIRMHAVDAGGGFGVRGEFYPEDFLVPWLARRLRRPVKWVEDRREHLVAANHSREQVHRIEVAMDDQGLILGLRDEVDHDNGAYVRTHGVIVPELTLAMLPGPYRVPTYAGRARVVLTNKTPCGTYRAPGRFEGTFAREQLLDVAADRLGLDRVELRRRNLLGPAELPHRRALNTLGTDVVLDGGDYPGLLEKAMGRVRDQGWAALVDGERAGGAAAGLGVAVFLEKSGLGPSETADVVVGVDGVVRVYSGGTSLGQGVETVLAQVAADGLGVDPAQVEVVNGDTDLQPFGLGSWASRTTVVAGSAVHLAAQATAAKARRVAARLLEAAEADLVVARGRVGVAGLPSRGVALGEVAAACVAGSPHLGGEEPGLGARERFDVEHMTYPYGVHVAVVRVDRDTGAVRVLRYLVAYEVGRAVNPRLVEGQLHGGVAQGVGGALLEEFRYDPAGQPQATTFMDYLLPTADVLCAVETLVCEDAPAPGNPLGARGAGEGGVTGAGAALACAVRDALGLVGGVGRLPMSAPRVALLADGGAT